MHVEERSVSEIIQQRPTAVSYAENSLAPSRRARSFSRRSKPSISPQSPLAWRTNRRKQPSCPNSASAPGVATICPRGNLIAPPPLRTPRRGGRRLARGTTARTPRGPLPPTSGRTQGTEPRDIPWDRERGKTRRVRSYRPRGLQLRGRDLSPPLARQEQEPVGAVTPEGPPAAARAPPPPVVLVHQPVALPVEKLPASLDQLLEVRPGDLHGDPPAHCFPLPLEPGLYALPVEGRGAVGPVV